MKPVFDRPQLIRAFISCTSSALLASCATLGTIDRTAEQKHFSLNGDGYFARCQFGFVPAGQRGVDFSQGVCGTSGDTIVVRKLDVKSSETNPEYEIRLDEAHRISLCNSAVIKQVQVHIRGGAVAMIFRPDGGVGFNDAAATEVFNRLKAKGWKTQTAIGRFDHGLSAGISGHGPMVSCD
jgi:hypothetical protein